MPKKYSSITVSGISFFTIIHLDQKNKRYVFEMSLREIKDGCAYFLPNPYRPYHLSLIILKYNSTHQFLFDVWVAGVSSNYQCLLFHLYRRERVRAMMIAYPCAPVMASVLGTPTASMKAFMMVRQTDSIFVRLVHSIAAHAGPMTLSTAYALRDRIVNLFAKVDSFLKTPVTFF